MKPEPTETRHTRRELLEKAEWLLGRPVADRQLVDWIELGLVPPPERSGRGATGGRGSTSSWTHGAYLLWLNLLASRASGPRIGELANAPVGLWLYADPDWISTTQIRRALRTWAARRSTYRSGELASNARQLVDRIKHPGSTASARRRLRVLLERPDWHSVPDRQLRTAIQAVIAPGQAVLAVGPLSPSAIADHVTATLLQRWVGVRIVLDSSGQSATDVELNSARLIARAETDAHARPGLARSLDQKLGAVNEPIGREARIQVACLDLVTVLGAPRLAEIDAAR